MLILTKKKQTLNMVKGFCCFIQNIVWLLESKKKNNNNQPTTTRTTNQPNKTKPKQNKQQEECILCFPPRLFFIAFRLPRKNRGSELLARYIR